MLAPYEIHSMKFMILSTATLLVIATPGSPREAPNGGCAEDVY